jgi:NitT/TauT family transport system substrate-binding protein
MSHLTRAALIQGAILAASARAAFAQSEKLTTVRFNAMAADAVRPVLYGVQSGVFRQAGLDVVWERAASGAVATQAIVGGASDIGQANILAMITAYARGIPFVMVAPSIMYRRDNATAGIVVGANSAIRTPVELQGKVVACATGGIAYLGLRAVIDKAGGDSSTVKFLELPNTAITAAIEGGRIDAGLLAEPNLMQDIRTGKVRFLVDELTGYDRPILEAVYFATREYASKNRDTIVRFAKALEKAQAYANAHVAETNNLLTPYTGLDPKVVAEMKHGYFAPTFDPAAIQPVIDLAAKYKVIPQRFEAKELLTTAL